LTSGSTRSYCTFELYNSKEVMIRRSFTPLPAEVARSAFGDCATFFFGWCLSTPRLMSSSPLLLKLWVLHAEVELPSASPDKRSKRGTLFLAVP